MTLARPIRLIVAAIMVVCGLAVVVHSAWPVHSQTAMNRDIASTESSNNIDDCMSARAHQLISAGQTVVVDAPNLGAWITLVTSLAPWARPVGATTAPHQVLIMSPGSGPTSCGGYVIAGQAGRTS